MQPITILAASAHRRDENESRNGIASLELPPASLLDERTLAEELNIGLTPVRNALHRLSLENLVVILPRRGTLVADLNMADLNKLFEMRIELEALACQLAATRATSMQRHALGLLAQETRRAYHTNSAKNETPRADAAQRASQQRMLIDLDQRIHRTIAEAAQNEFLRETLDNLYIHVLRLWYIALDRISTLDRSIEEHLAIIDAVQHGDGAHAAEQMRQHVLHFQQKFMHA